MATIVQLAGMLPNDPDFRVWVGDFIDGPEATKEQAADFIRIVCEVTSRTELATNPHAEQRFHRYLRKQFLAWKAKR